MLRDSPSDDRERQRELCRKRRPAARWLLLCPLAAAVSFGVWMGIGLVPFSEPVGLGLTAAALLIGLVNFVLIRRW